MRRLMILPLGLALAAAALLPACRSQAPARQTAKPSEATSAATASKLNTASMNPQERMYVEGFLRGSNSANGKKSYEATVVAGEDDARGIFPGAKFPTFGPGKQVAIISLTALDLRQNPRASLAAVYRGGLIVYESRFEGQQPQLPQGEAVTVRPGVQGVLVQPKTKLPNEASVMEIVWSEGDVTYLVRGAGKDVTKDELLKVAQSMK